jgi:hypothetical protein
MSAEEQISIEAIRAVKQTYESQLLRMANVVGVGIGFRTCQGVRTDDPALVVLVSRKLPPELLSPQERIPAELDGVPVDVQEVGHIYSQ